MNARTGSHRRGGTWLILFTLAVALALDSVKLPYWFDLFRPCWLILILVYWTMHSPSRIGIASGWVLGLIVDLSRDALLGQNALALALVAFIASNTHQQLRLAPVWQQALSVTIFAMVGKLVVLWINGMIGYPPQNAYFLLAIPTNLIVWPVLVLLLSDLSRIYHVD